MPTLTCDSEIESDSPGGGCHAAPGTDNRPWNCAPNRARWVAAALGLCLIGGCASLRVVPSAARAEIGERGASACVSEPRIAEQTGGLTAPARRTPGPSDANIKSTANKTVRSADRCREAFRLWGRYERELVSLAVFDKSPAVHLVSVSDEIPTSSFLFGHTPPRSDWLAFSSSELLDAASTDERSEGRHEFGSESETLGEFQDQFTITGGDESPGDTHRLSDDIRQRVWDDHRQFYSRDSLCRLGLGLAVAAVMANTQIDQRLTDEISLSSQSNAADDFADFTKNFGEGMYTFPLFVTAALIGQCSDRWPQASLAGNWGSRCLRTAGVGAPPLFVIQRATGGSRPDSPSGGSEWDFFDKPHGASGHTFMGAIPFITAAKMTDDLLLKSGLYVCSTLTGWSRVYHRGHFVSQAVLGWWIAYLAASAVDETESEVRRFEVVPLILSEGAGLGIEFRR